MTADYDGPPLDGTVQYLSEAPHWTDDDAETVYATAPEPAGEETTEDVPLPDGGESQPPDRDGQATLDDFAGGSA